MIDLRKHLEQLMREKAENEKRVIELEEKLARQAETADDAAMMSAERAQTIDRAFQAAQEEINMLKVQLAAANRATSSLHGGNPTSQHHRESVSSSRNPQQIQRDSMSSSSSSRRSVVTESSELRATGGFLSSVWGVAGSVAGSVSKRLGSNPALSTAGSDGPLPIVSVPSPRSPQSSSDKTPSLASSNSTENM